MSQPFFRVDYSAPTGLVRQTEGPERRRETSPSERAHSLLTLCLQRRQDPLLEVLLVAWTAECAVYTPRTFAFSRRMFTGEFRKFRIAAVDDKEYLTGFYDLDAITEVGFRVHSARAIQFRQWAADVLRDFTNQSGEGDHWQGLIEADLVNYMVALAGQIITAMGKFNVALAA